MKNTIFDPVALKDIIAWASHEPKIVKKIFELIADIHKHPFEGLGKPEGLKYQLIPIIQIFSQMQFAIGIIPSNIST